jgi:hypothetical protein
MSGGLKIQAHFDGPAAPGRCVAVDKLIQDTGLSKKGSQPAILIDDAFAMSHPAGDFFMRT